MMRILKLLIFSFLIFMFSEGVFAFDEMNRRIGIIYLRNAAANYLNGDYGASLSFLDKAGEFYPWSSDYDYINGLIKLERDNDLIAAAKYFEQAVDSDNWLLLEKKDCVKDLSLLFFRKKKYEAAVNLIEENALPGFGDNDLMYIFVLSLRSSGQIDKYERALLKSINYYPDDYRFGELFIDYSYEYRKDVLLGKIKYRNKEGADSVFLKAVISADESYSKINFLEKYFNQGGSDLKAYVEYYRLRGDLQVSELEELIDNGLFENPENTFKLKGILHTNILKETFQKSRENYTGNIYFDYNNDGYYEEMHLFEGGIPVGISIDENQDALIETMLIFQEGEPSEIISSDSELVKISYSEYPFVDEVSITEDEKNTVYKIMNKTLSLNSYYARSLDNKIVFLKNETNDFIQNIDMLRENSIMVSEYSGVNNIGRMGILVRQLERKNENYALVRIYDKIFGNYIYHQSRNNKLTGFADLNFNNLIDIKENYTDGILTSIEADENENGVYDYKISFENETSISWWDFNEDGVYDCRQYKKKGILFKEYSSRLDGIFDIVERD